MENPFEPTEAGVGLALELEADEVDLVAAFRRPILVCFVSVATSSGFCRLSVFEFFFKPDPFASEISITFSVFVPSTCD